MQKKLSIFGAALLLSQLLPAHALATGQQEVSSSQPFAASGATVPLTLAQAVELALAASPQLRATAQNVAIAEAAKQQASAMPNPELSFVREGMRRGTRTQTWQLSQPIELGGKRSARVGVADNERLFALGDLDAARAELRSDVVAAYLETLTAQERLALAERSVQLADKAASAAARRVTAGKISPVEQTRSSVAAAGARIDASQAAAELAMSRRRLAALWGSTETLQHSLVAPELELSAIPRLEELQTNLQASPQLRRARSVVDREAAQVRLERAQGIPDVTVTVGTQKDDQIGRSQTVVGLSLPLPLFNRNQGNLLSALRRVDKAQAELEVERVRLSQGVAEAWQRATVSQQQIESLKGEMLPAAQSAFDAAVTGFELGKFSFLDVLDAQRTLFQAREQYLRALSERYRSIADLQRYTVVGVGNSALNMDRTMK